MQAQVGDELTVKGHQGDEDRHGEIIEVIGADGAPPYMVRWRDGFESLFYIRLRPGSATAQDRAPDTRGRAHLIHHPSGDGTGDAPSALALVCAGRRRHRRRLDRLSLSVRPGQLLSFNDDIQGTAAVVLAALSAGAAATGSRLRDQMVVMLSAGSAGIGVCEQVVRSMVADGLPGQGARARICVVDINGLLTTDRPDLSPAQRRLAQPPPAVPGTEPGRPASLTDVIDAVHPTALIGLSTASGAFTEQVVRRIAAHAKRPIIMPLSNPTSRSEARPQDLADWTEGRALVATGSPFPPMRVGDASIPVAQCNNIYIFPGVGLAVTAVRATRVTNAMMTAAAAAVGDAATIRHDPYGTLLPDRAQLAGTATAVARAVARAAVADAVAPALTHDQIDQAIDRTRWLPRYQALSTSVLIDLRDSGG